MGNDTASRVGWGVLLGGEEWDLEEWREALRQSFDPWVTEDGLILRSSSLDRATTGSEAYDRATALMDQVNGALAVRCRARVVRLEGIVEILSDGTRRPAPVLASFNVTERPDKLRAMATVGEPKPPPPPEPSEIQRWLSIAAKDALLADALTFFGRGDDWFDTYKALECLIGRFGGGKEADFRALGWVSADKIKLLKHTADSWRHSPRGRLNVDPPDPPMERAEARDLLAKLMARAFHEAPATPPPKRGKGGRKSLR
jgi:hypothetical protein